MRVLVTGGTGLVGRDIVAHLLGDADTEVIVVSRRPPAFRAENLRWHEHDLSSFAPLPDVLFDDVDCLVHGAAHLQYGSRGDYLAAAQLNFSRTTELYAQAVAHGVRKAVYLSGFNFLSKPLQSCIDEAHAVGPVNPYALAKLWGETALFGVLRGSSTIPVALRISSPVPRRVEELHDTVLRRWISTARNGRAVVVFGRGGRRQDYVSTQDVAEAVSRVQRKDAEGVFNIGSGDPRSNAEVASLIAETYAVPVEFEGEDEQDGDTWNISIERAARIFGFVPRFSSLDAIRALMD